VLWGVYLSLARLDRYLTFDAYVEAMSTNRPYRIARSKNEVIAELADGRGIRYDAEIADIVLRLLEKDALIAEQVLI